MFEQQNMEKPAKISKIDVNVSARKVAWMLNENGGVLGAARNAQHGLFSAACSATGRLRLFSVNVAVLTCDLLLTDVFAVVTRCECNIDAFLFISEVIFV